MPKQVHRQKKTLLIWGIILVLGTSMACQLTSPRPASWSGTPTAAARNTEIALTQAAIAGAGNFVFTPTLPTRTPEITPTLISPTPQTDTPGPWLIFINPQGQGLRAYDLSAQKTIEIDLPEPIIDTDLTRGVAPDGSKLILRAGSALNTDELALYQIDLPSFGVNKLSPLLSIPVQRKIVNNDSALALETLAIVTHSDGLAWSPNSRYLAFTAALDGETSDLYFVDIQKNRIDRLNGLLSQNTSPTWSPDGNWLISQELEFVHQLEEWHSMLVSGIRIPSFDSQNTIYNPHFNSLEEVIVGWLNPSTFISYSNTDAGPWRLRQVNMEGLQVYIIIEDFFQEVGFDPASGVIAFTINYSTAAAQGLAGGIYRRTLDSPVNKLQATGNWSYLTWDSGGMFVASGAQGVLLFTPQGESMLLPGEGHARLSPNGSWFITWGDGINTTAGARLFQSHNSSPLQTLINEPVEVLFWQPDSKGFFILSEGSLYRYIFPGLKPDEVITGLPEGAQFIWVEQPQ
ncbi:MAG: hypothetical protein GX142_02055 [Chloroflexi bacterium]|nr:hypothetical protein [Chloroflexota bacterium]